MKICSGCKIEKPLRCFAKNKTRKDGLQHYCKECKSVLKRKYAQTDACKKSNRKYKQSSKGKAATKRHDLSRRKRHPEKYKARYKVANAIKRGWLIPQPCEICGSEESIESHHEDYTKPLEVNWLCTKCHRDIERTKDEKMQSNLDG